MATLLDQGFIGFLTPFFIFLFIFVLFYALMEKFDKFFGKNSGLHGLIAFCLAILFVVVPEARGIINIVTPWFVVLVVFGLLIIVGLMFLGYKEETMVGIISDGGTITVLAIVAVVILFLIAITSVFGPSSLEPGGTGFLGTIRHTLFNPKLLGVAFILIVASEVIRKLGFRE